MVVLVFLVNLLDVNGSYPVQVKDSLPLTFPLNISLNISGVPFFPIDVARMSWRSPLSLGLM